MAREDWFRRTSWSESDRAAFFARLDRSRSADAKAQYLRIQAWHLAEAGALDLTRNALELLGLIFSEYPSQQQVAQAHCQAAHCHERLGDLHSAVREFRHALTSEASSPNVRTRASIEFPWLVAMHRLASLYDEALGVLTPAATIAAFPIDLFKAAAVQALIADARHDFIGASRYASVAIAAAARTQSDFRYHRTIGLVGAEHDPLIRRLHDLVARCPVQKD